MTYFDIWISKVQLDQQFFEMIDKQEKHYKDHAQINIEIYAKEFD